MVSGTAFAAPSPSTNPPGKNSFQSPLFCIDRRMPASVTRWYSTSNFGPT